MDKDLIEPGDSSESKHRLHDDETDTETCSPAPPPLITPSKTAETQDVTRFSTWTSPAERAAIEMSQRRKMTRMKPSVPYLVLSCVQTGLGSAIAGVGGAAFATTPSFRAGCFWAGLLVLLLSVYSLVLLCLKLALHKNKWFKKGKHTMYHILIALCIVCILATIAAAIMDTLAAYMLHRTDFSRCLYTDTRLAIDCNSEICSNMHLAPNTCYCCYLYNNREAKGCDTPFLLDKQTYFEGIDSCDVLMKRLHPMLVTVGLLCLVSTVLNIVFLFKSRPVRYYVKSDKGEEVEVGEEGKEEEGVVRRLIHKLRRGRERDNVHYSAANTEDTIVD